MGVADQGSAVSYSRGGAQDQEALFQEGTECEAEKGHAGQVRASLCWMWGGGGGGDGAT